MKIYLKPISTILISILALNGITQKQPGFIPKEAYRSRQLIIQQISENSFQHISFLQTNDFGNVPCNGLVVRNSTEAIVFDTPANDTASDELIKWIQETLHCRINAVIPTHFHNDCLAGLKSFDKNNIPSYANTHTIELAKENRSAIPRHGFRDSVVLTVGNAHIIAKFFGEGHTKDNIIGYFPADHVMFGGCLIKELNAGKGFLGDANTAAWSATVEKIKQAYPHVKIIVPGHGAYGNHQLLDYTIRLFRP